jgi:hypothetical protein
MFAEIDAEICVLVDGDATYDSSRAGDLVATRADDDLDRVTAVRDDGGKSSAYRTGHRVGNRMFNWLLGALFGVHPADMLSGYRAFSRRFVKAFPADATGFEIETGLTAHALDLRVPTGELLAQYVARPQGSASKLNKWRDGLRILSTVAQLFRGVRPLRFFTTVALLRVVVGLALGTSVAVEFMHTGLVPRFPTALLATGLMLLASLSLACGLILDSVARGRREAKRLAYLVAGAVFAPQ